VDTGEDWAVIAGARDVYLRWRRAGENLAGNSGRCGTRLIGLRGKRLWVRVDTRNKRILCGVPMGSATSPNRILVLDYRSLSNAE